MMRWLISFAAMLAHFLALLALALPAPAQAWWEYGHHTVASVAMANVSPKTAARVRELLREEAGLGTPGCRVRSLEDAAYWPDCIKADNWRWGYTGPWHYQTEPVCKPYDPRANCANGNCVSAQIERSRRLLADQKLPKAQRLEALAFLSHFVGDIHMPLHSGDNGDAGGNGIDAHYGEANARNLHAVWDGPLAERAISSTIPPLVRRYSAEERSALGGGTVADWGAESWQLARDLVYPFALDRDPCTGPNPEAIVWTNADIEASLPALQKRITQAGLRLARLLDEALGG